MGTFYRYVRYYACCGCGRSMEEDERRPIVSDDNLPLSATSQGTTSAGSTHRLSTALSAQSSYLTSEDSAYEDRAVELDDKTKGKKLFNRHPKKGIAFLREQGVLDGSPESIAAFLCEDFVDKSQIGEYLGQNEPLQIQVLKAFAHRFDFTGLPFDAALRRFIDAFRLPGEAQKIDRIMETFATRYCEQNPGVFASPDTAYILSFSLIMLNTDLHNPNIKRHMTREAFIKNNHGINEGKDLPPALLGTLYDSFKRQELQLTQGRSFQDTSYTFFNPDREGYLWKEGTAGLNWQRRYFVVTGSVLYYFKTNTDKKPSAIIPLENLGVRELERSGFGEARTHFPFELYDIDAATRKTPRIKAVKFTSGSFVKSEHKSFVLASESAEDRAEWIKCILASMAPPAVYILRQLKKDKLAQQQQQSMDLSSESYAMNSSSVQLAFDAAAAASSTAPVQLLNDASPDDSPSPISSSGVTAAPVAIPAMDRSLLIPARDEFALQPAPQISAPHSAPPLRTFVSASPYGAAPTFTFSATSLPSVGELAPINEVSNAISRAETPPEPHPSEVESMLLGSQ